VHGVAPFLLSLDGVSLGVQSLAHVFAKALGFLRIVKTVDDFLSRPAVQKVAGEAVPPMDFLR